MEIVGIKTQTHDLSYDKIVKNILTQSNEMTIRFINGLFNSDIPVDAPLEWLDKESINDQFKAIVADLYPCIGGQMFSIEIESYDKGGMALRILKYAVGGALRHGTLETDEEITIDLPRPCVIFLKSGTNTPKQLIWNINSFDGQKMKVIVPVLRLGDLTVREIAERNLFPIGQFFLRTLEPLTTSKLDVFSKTAQALISELKDSVERGVIPAHVGLKIQDNIRKTAENAVSKAKLEGVDLEMAEAVLETLTCIDYDDVFRQLEDRGRSEGITQGRNALAKEMAVTAFRQEGRIQAIVVNDLKRLGISEQIINAAKDLVDKEKEAERPK